MDIGHGQGIADNAREKGYVGHLLETGVLYDGLDEGIISKNDARNPHAFMV